ncbi:MAG: CehA/McbA family metallohydrolase [Planctomycetaceae bacterium]|nr:CehA/McbA family metallohydrolase [Planctomycetaceae bacterium]
MDRRTFVKISGAVAAQSAVLSVWEAAAQSPPAEPAQSLINPFTQQGQWFKAALHVHTTTSDGDVDVPTRLAQYRAAGYQVVAVTDHWKTNDLSGCSDDQFLCISGMEAHPRTGTGAPTHHFVCLNLPHPFELARDLPAQALIDQVINAGGKVIYAHPYWTAHSLEEMTEVSGYVGIEVFNAVCQLACNKGHNSVHWDQLLNKGRIVAGVATDDVHATGQINLGWTMIKAPSLDTNAVLNAIESGCFYSSCGPIIEDCRIEEGTIRVVTSPVRQISFFFDGAAGGHVVRAGAGQTLTTAQWNFGNRQPKCRWIRVEVVDQDDKYAWTNPMR